MASLQIEPELYYIGVAFKTTLLSGFSKNEGNFKEFLGKIIRYLKYGRYILTYKDNNIFYIKDKEDSGLTFLLISNEYQAATPAFVALERARDDFLRYFTKEEYTTCKSGGLQRDFEGRLERHFVVLLN